MLKLEDVTKVFRSDGCVVRALDHVTLELPFEGLLIIAGSNGSGKSSLLNTAAGSLEPDTGRVLLDARDITALPDFRRRFIGRLYQNAHQGTCLDLTVEENLSIAQMDGGPALWRAARSAKKRARIVEAARDVAADLGLDARLNEKVGNLSGGQMQIINIIFLMLRRPRPELVLADEPTGNLDPQNSERCILLLKELSEAAGVAMVTHNAMAYPMGDRLIVMHKGRIVSQHMGDEVGAIDPMEEIRRHEPSLR